MAALAAEDDVHTTVRRPNGATQFEPPVEHTVSATPNAAVEVCVTVAQAPKGDHAVSCHSRDVVTLPPMPHRDPSCGVQHPNCNSNCRIRSYGGVGNAERGCGGGCLAPEGDQAVSCHPWGVGPLTQCLMSALAAEDGVRTTARLPYGSRPSASERSNTVSGAPCMTAVGC